MHTYLLVGLGGGLGAMARYGVGVAVGRNIAAPFPLATFTVNVAGSLAMGLLIGLLARFTPDWQASARVFVAVGVLGGFTTFSAFSLDFVTLFERGEIGMALAYAIGSVIVSVLALFVGMALIRGHFV